jgi:hypothetical protein
MHALAFTAAAACLVATWTTPTAAQPSAYAGRPPSSIKALTPDEVTGYLDGAGMGFALAAELNGYPGPRHVLELADSLGLDAARRAAVQTIFDGMNTEARTLGAAIVAAEAELDSAFAEARITDDELSDRVSRIAALRGRLRVAHLSAHLAVTRLLTPAERQAYRRLRGYADGALHDHHHD